MASVPPSLGLVNKEPHVRKATVHDLGSGEHFITYTSALQRVMSTDVSRLAYAQIVDGAPLSRTASSMPTLDRPLLGHPVWEHSELCYGVQEKLGQILDVSNLHVLEFDFDLLRRYLAASPGSRAFKNALIELMAVSVHKIAAYIYKLDLDVGSHKGVLKPDSDALTLFLHKQYRDIAQYPDGVADAVGYWAEAHIFGGVILFDRRQQLGPAKIRGDDCFLPWNRGEDVYRKLQLLDPEEWEDYEMFLSHYLELKQPLHEQDPYEIYLHSNNRDVTYRIWQLLPEQRKDLFEFLLSETRPTTSPFPILPSDKNLFRIDPEDPITETRICRDVWERKPLRDDDGDKRSHHCRGDRVEYPCRADEERSKGRGFFRRECIFEMKLLESRARELAMASGQGPQSDLAPTQD